MTVCLAFPEEDDDPILLFEIGMEYVTGDTVVFVDLENRKVQIRQKDGAYRMIDIPRKSGNDRGESILNHLLSSYGDEFHTLTKERLEEVFSEAQPKKDNVNSPAHYNQSGIETIEIIKQVTNGYKNGFDAYCVGNTIKYLSRAPFKHDSVEEDINKAKKYLEFLIEAKGE